MELTAWEIRFLLLAQSHGNFAETEKLSDMNEGLG